MDRIHYIQKNISDVTVNDSKVAITGRIVNSGNGFAVMDDGTGKIEVAADIQTGKNEIVRMFCSVIDSNLKADIVQKMNAFDLDLFKKINELYIKAGV